MCVHLDVNIFTITQLPRKFVMLRDLISEMKTNCIFNPVMTEI